ncbi:putative entry exclusion protein TrbK-alt [Bosea vestrisii]|uniref:Entry exclusion protein TrbK-alt n=1 Tax=Bosea vestrisii TaxID=151416 RepID=A0ABW0HBH6_9HYPH
MDSKMLARVGAILFIAVAITATVIELTREDDAPASEPMRALRSEAHPPRKEQRRCQQLGQAAVNDAECLRVWAETRDRFLGKTPAPASSEGR